MGKLLDTIKKAGQDAVKSIKDQLNDAGENISNTTKEVVGNIKNNYVSTGESIRSNNYTQNLKNAIAQAYTPVKNKIASFSIDANGLGFAALIPFKSSMISLLQKRGYEVSNNDSISKIAVMFNDNIISRKNNLEHEESSVDWGEVVKICGKIVDWMKSAWTENQKKREEEELRKAQFADEVQRKAYENYLNKNKTDLDLFSEDTLNTALGEENNSGKKDWSKLLPILLIVLGVIVAYKIFKN